MKDGGGGGGALTCGSIEAEARHPCRGPSPAIPVL